MLGFTLLSQPSLISRPIPSIPMAHILIPPHSVKFFASSSSTLKCQPLIFKKLKKFVVSAEDNNEMREKETEEQNPKIGSNGDDNSNKNRRPLFSFNLGSLLDPDPDNVLALGLTGLLTWASVQVLWQLLFISLAILVAALKYSLIAAVLIFILITLL